MAGMIGLLVAAATAYAAAAAPLMGENISGGELNPGTRHARLWWDYLYPTPQQLDYAASKHMSVIRMPIIWERLQGTLASPLDIDELARIKAVLASAASRKLTVVLDLHNYGQFGGIGGIGSRAVPTAAFAKIWSLLATQLKDSPLVAFGLMNEPHNAGRAEWRDAAQQAIYAIRAAGARQLILVPGVDWDGAHDFVGGPGSSSALMADIYDPARNMVFEVHQYFDHDDSGTHADCRSGEAMRALLLPLEAWARRVHRQVFLGEFGVAATPACLASLDTVLGHLDHNRDVWRGWTYWAAGGWWGSYPFSIEPQGGQDKPQMKTLSKYLPKS